MCIIPYGVENKKCRKSFTIYGNDFFKYFFRLQLEIKILQLQKVRLLHFCFNFFCRIKEKYILKIVLKLGLTVT